jgi:hypothetical protein
LYAAPCSQRLDDFVPNADIRPLGALTFSIPVHPHAHTILRFADVHNLSI